MFEYSDCKQTAEFLKNKIPSGVKTAIILGSGLGKLCDKLTNKTEIAYTDIPGFVKSTVDSHKGVLISGKLYGTPCLVMAGRFHYYEGYEFSQTAFPIYVFKLLGIENLIVTNAAGGINENFAVGDFMAINDHIKLVAESPVRGKNIDEFGLRFFDMTTAYDKEFLTIINDVAKKNEIELRNGVYAYMAGPQFETPAEIRMLRTMGADAVGMSTVAEVISAAHCGLRVLGLSCISNMAAGITGQPLNDDDVTEATAKSSDNFEKLLKGFLDRIGE